MADAVRFTTADLDLLPQPLDDKRYEIIDGELYVSSQPHAHHQMTCDSILFELQSWSRGTGAGISISAPGIIFAPDDNVAPDVVWASHERLAAILGDDGKLHAAPELIVEVLSPGAENERRDREVKLNLYARRGVREYWIASYQQRQVEVYRRVDASLRLIETLFAEDTLRTPLLPGFTVLVHALFPAL